MSDENDHLTIRISPSGCGFKAECEIGSEHHAAYGWRIGEAAARALEQVITPVRHIDIEVQVGKESQF